MFCDLCFNFKNMSLTLFAEVGCLGQSKELKDSEVNDINIKNCLLDRMVDRVKPWFMVHGLAHGS